MTNIEKFTAVATKFEHPGNVCYLCSDYRQNLLKSDLEEIERVCGPDVKRNTLQLRAKQMLSRNYDPFSVVLGDFNKSNIPCTTRTTFLECLAEVLGLDATEAEKIVTKLHPR